MPIEEIVVTGKRTPAPAGLPPPAVPDYYNTFERDLDNLDDQERAQDAAIEAYEKSKTIPEIVVTAKKPSLVAAALAMTRSQMMGIGRTATRLAEPIFDAATAARFQVDLLGTQTIPEIVVTAKRLKVATGFASRLALPVSIAEGSGRLGAAIARELQRQAIDELADWATRTDYPGPDTKVRTMPKVKTETAPAPAREMEEIIVTARRPRATTFAEPGLTRSQIAGFQRDMMTQSGAGFSVGTITAPTIPQVKTKTKTKTLTQIATRTKTLTLPITGVSTRRSTALGIGTGVATGVLTGVATGVMPATSVSVQSQVTQFTRTGQRTKYCKPKPKKARTQCWKKLVKEARFESQDKVSKWVKINCDTGRELRSTK